MEKEPSGEILTNIWIGAAFFWLISGFRGSFKLYTDVKYNQRNMWVGYGLTMGALTLIIYFLVELV